MDILAAIRLSVTAYAGRWFALVLALAGWQCGRAADAPPAVSSAARDLLVEKLYSPLEHPADFEEAAAQAARAGLPAQTIAEAQLAFDLRTHTLNAGLNAAIDNLEALRASLRWRKDDSRLFDDADELEGTLFFARALLTEQSGDPAEYARCLKEAFWWNPSAGALFGNALREHRQRDALAGVSVPPGATLRNSGGGNLTMKDLLAGHKAVLLEFWASWCDPAMKGLDDLPVRAEALAAENIATAGVDVEEDASLAEQVRLAHKITFLWLVETGGKPLCHLLGVQEIPHAVLLGADGKVLFSGHPDDAGLRKALQGLGVTKGL